MKLYKTLANRINSVRSREREKIKAQKGKKASFPTIKIIF